MRKENIETYRRRAEKLDVQLLSVDQTHLGADGGLELIRKLYARLKKAGVVFALGETAGEVDLEARTLRTDRRVIGFDALLIAPGRGGFSANRLSAKR